MTTMRKIYEDLPNTIEVPAELRHRRAEVIILPLEDEALPISLEEVDENGWPIGYFERVFGSAPDFPPRAPQGEPDIRDPLE
jgi:hypothetical protein